MVQPQSGVCSDVCDSPECAIPGSIHISQSMRIDEPREAPILRKIGEDQIRVLIVPDRGDQRLVIFQLPKDRSVTCKVEQLLGMLKSQLHEEEIDKTYLVNDPVHNVRYVVTMQTKLKGDKPNKVSKDATVNNNNSCTPTKKSRKRKRNSSESSYSFSTSSSDIIEVQCHSSDQRLTLDLRRNAQVIVIYPNRPTEFGVTVTIEDFKCLDPDEYLNDVIIDFYLKYLILEKLPINDQNRTYVFNTYFYTKLANPKCTSTNANMSLAKVQHAEVKRWTKNVNIFEKDFIVVPIHQNQHWFLAVICYPALVGMKYKNKSEDSKNYPCIIIFDSLPSFTVGRPRVARDLKNYLECEYSEKNGGSSLFFDDMEVVYADVPQQLNLSDCGLYLLQFVESFFKDFVVTNSFMMLKKPLSHWFSANVISKKRNDLRKLIICLAMDSREIKRK